jgi:hypothetical protein
MKRKLVLVTWIDTAFEPGWKTSYSTPPTYSVCKTAGYLIEKSKKKVVISMNINEDGGYGECMIFPRGNVKKIEVLTWGK